MSAGRAAMTWLLAVGACARSSAPPAKEEAPVSSSSTKASFSAEARPTKPRSALPSAIAPLVPRRGIYAAGGGLVSSPWRVIVDLDAGTLAAGRSQGRSKPSYGKLDQETTRSVDERERAELVALADRAWREPAAPFAPPNADYDEILILADGDDTFFLQGYGRIRAPAAAELIARLRLALP